jgi:hypothetical protein
MSSFKPCRRVRAFDNWEEYEEFLRKEKESWD